MSKPIQNREAVHSHILNVLLFACCAERPILLLSDSVDTFILSMNRAKKKKKSMMEAAKLARRCSQNKSPAGQDSGMDAVWRTKTCCLPKVPIGWVKYNYRKLRTNTRAWSHRHTCALTHTHRLQLLSASCRLNGYKSPSAGKRFSRETKALQLKMMMMTTMTIILCCSQGGATRQRCHYGSITKQLMCAVEATAAVHSCCCGQNYETQLLFFF